MGIGCTGPKVVNAHLGLATALNALCRRDEAAEGLARAAEAASARGEHVDAMRLLGEALAIDPSRMELHLDLAMLEEAMGRHAAAVARIDSLADRYMDDGRFDEAAELLSLLASWDEDAEGQTPAPKLETQPSQTPTLVPRNIALITGETVIAHNPLLRPLVVVQAASEAERAMESRGTVVQAGEWDMESRVTLVHGDAPHSEPRPRLRRTKPLVFRSSSEPRDEDVTRCFQRPQGLDVAI